MKDGLKYLIGKRIAGVVVAASERHSPKQQVFLVFTDGTRFEFWGENFSCCSGLDRAFGIADYIKSGGGEIRAVYKDVVKATGQPKKKGPLPPNPPHFATAEIAAWHEAAKAIHAAKAS